MLASSRHRLSVLIAALMAAGCGAASQVGNPSPQPSAQGQLGQPGEAGAQGNLGGAGTDEKKDLLQGQTLFDAVYDINVKSLFGISVCEGEAQLKISASFDIKPQGIVKCLFNSITLDLGKMLDGLGGGAAGAGAAGAGGAQPTEVGKGIVVEDHIIYMTNIAGAQFDPPRPLLVSVFSATKKEMRKLRTSANHSVTTTDGKRGNGSISLNVLGVDETVQTKGMSRPFTKVLHWQVSAQGFDGVKPKGFLFDSVDFYWNLEPIAIPMIKLKGHIRDFLGEGGLDGLAGGGQAGQGGQGGGGLGSILGGLGGGGQQGGLFDIFKDLAVDIAGDFDIELQLREMSGLDMERDDDD